jgi:cytochrome c oxidase cbb3-type subunit 3
MNYLHRVSIHLSTALACACFAFGATATGAASDQYAHAEHLYDTYCVQCHGVNRNGKGLNSAHMSVQPRDHSDAKGMADIPDKELFDAIKQGGLAVNKSVLMPIWGNVLNDDQINELVAYLRHVCECGSEK